MLIVQRPQIEELQVSDTRSRFVVEPLEPGFGYTLGNTLRRTLLSRIPGAAITTVRIEGVQHEFSTIDGVVEDVVDLMLNLKQVVLRIDAAGTVTLFSGKTELGQDIRTSIAMIGADELDVSLARIQVITGDTSQTPNEGYTVSSMSLETSGNAIRYAAAEVRQGRAVERIVLHKAVLEHVPEEEPVTKGGGWPARAPSLRLPETISPGQRPFGRPVSHPKLLAVRAVIR